MPRLIESLLDKSDLVSGMEIALVDSASTDRTIEAASHYPITVIQLQPSQRLTAALGRYVGYQHSCGELILFLDGDMELCDGWLERALAVLKDNPTIAAITGKVIDRPSATPYGDKLPVEPLCPPSLNSERGLGGEVDVKHGGGAALYRRAVLEQVGSFNPYIYSDEEPELCVRIRHSGYRIVQLDYPIVFHYSDPIEAMSTLIARWKRRLYLGAGQNLRYHFGKEVFWPYFKERGFGILPAIGLMGGFVALAWSAIGHQWLWFGLWLAALGAVIGPGTYRQHSLYPGPSSLLLR